MLVVNPLCGDVVQRSILILNNLKDSQIDLSPNKRQKKTWLKWTYIIVYLVIFHHQNDFLRRSSFKLLFSLCCLALF